MSVGMISHAATAQTARLAEISSTLGGQWTLLVAGDARPRLWEVTRVLHYDGDLYMTEGTYGYRDGDWRPVVAEVEDRADGLAIALPSPVNSALSLRLDGEGRISGTFESTGAPRPLSGTKLTSAERVTQPPHFTVLGLEKPLSEAVWAAAMSGMPSGRSSSPLPAPLPDNLKIRTPLPSVPASRARFSGRWSGWACYFAGTLACETRLAVLTIYGDRADVVHTWGDKSMKEPRIVRTIGRFVGDQLYIPLPNTNEIYYEPRWDGGLNVIVFLNRKPGPDNGRVGVMTRE